MSEKVRLWPRVFNLIFFWNMLDISKLNIFCRVHWIYELHELEPAYSVEIFNLEVRLAVRLFLNSQLWCLVESRTVCTYIKGYDLPCGPWVAQRGFQDQWIVVLLCWFHSLLCPSISVIHQFLVKPVNKSKDLVSPDSNFTLVWLHLYTLGANSKSLRIFNCQ